MDDEKKFQPEYFAIKRAGIPRSFALEKMYKSQPIREPNFFSHKKWKLQLFVQMRGVKALRPNNHRSPKIVPEEVDKNTGIHAVLSVLLKFLLFFFT